MSDFNYTRDEARELMEAFDDRHDIVLTCEGINHGYPTKDVLCEVNLEIGRGQIVGLVGPSGCGKSTLLRAVVGTHPANSGTIETYGTGLSADATVMSYDASRQETTVVRGPGRDRGIVYQRYTLYPNLTAVQNVAIGLQWDQTTLPDRIFRPFRQRRLRKQWLEEAANLLVKVGLGDSLHKYPTELSGGMCQRVAIAQALIMKPEVLLMDEPFGALDEATREDLQRMMLTLYGENLDALKRDEKPPYTVIIVTHELNEALYLGDRVIGLSQYWDWQNGLQVSEGHRITSFPRHPGATVVYDAAAPVHDAEGNRDFEELREQRETIREQVFEPDETRVPGDQVTFWDHVEAGHTEGVMA